MHHILAAGQRRRSAPFVRIFLQALFAIALAWALPAAAQVTFSPASLPSATQGVAYSQTVTASGGVAPYTFTLVGGTLPTGMVYSAAGVISGTPTTLGTYSFTFGAYDSTPVLTTRSYTIVVNPPGPPPPTPTASIVVADTSLTVGETSGVTITFNTAVTGFTTADLTVANGSLSGLSSGDGGITWTATLTPTAGIVDPSNLIILNNAGVTNIVGTPGTGTTSSNNYAINTVQLTLDPTSLPDALVAVGYSQTITASGGTGPYAFSLSSGSLPPGLTLSSGGLFAGTPTAAGLYNFTLAASDANASTGSRPYSVNVTNPPPVAANLGGVSVPYETATVIDLGGSITGVHTSIAITAAPAHGTTSITGDIVTYTPAAGYFGADSFTYTATGPGGTSAPATVSLNVTTPPAPIAADVNGGIVPYNGSGTAIDLGSAITGVHSSIAIGTAPAHGTTSVAGDVVTYTPTAGYAGADDFTYTATGPGGTSAPATVALTVAAPTLALAPGAGTLTATYGTAYTQVFAASGGTGPYTYALAGTLPAGLSFAGDTLSGTATEPGSFPVTITATDSSTGTGAPFSVSANYTIDVAAPVITLDPPALADGTVASAYSASVTASGGAAPYAYSLTAGSLPAGLTLAADGSLGGTPSAAGSFNLAVTAVDDNGQSGSRAYTLTIAAPTLVLTPGAGTLAATYDTAYSQAFAASGGTGPYTYALTGTLPAGLNFTAGTLSGTATEPGSFPVTITATDSSTGTGAPFSVTGNFTVEVAAPIVAITPATLPGGTAGTAYTAQLTASGGSAPYAFWIVDPGNYPPGMGFDGSGNLSGTPTTEGTYTFTVEVADQYSQGTQRTYTIVIAIEPPTAGDTAATVAYDSSNNAIAPALSGGVADSIAIATPATHGTATASGTSISYTPAAGYAGADSFTYTATNASGTSAPATVTVTVNDPALAIAGSGPATSMVAAAYSQTFTFSGGTAPYTASVGGLPAGVGVSASSADSVTVSGTPTQAGAFTISVSGTDSSSGNGPFSLTQGFPLTITAPTLALAPGASTFAADYNTAFSQAFAASGGTGPHTYVLTGALPAGVSFNGGTLSGTPTASGSFGFTITATDSSTGIGAPFTVAVDYTLDVAAATLVLTPANLPDGTAGSAYSQSLAATGGIGPYSFALDGGSLPTGVNLAADGTLGGTPTVAGSFNFTVEATDANGQTGSQAYTLTTAAPVLAMARTVLPGGVVGTPYQESLTVNGGTAPYGFAITGGALPAGLALAADGTISGTPTTAGSNSFTVTATDALGFSASGSFNVGIAEAVPVAADDLATTLSEQPVSIAVTANDSGVIATIAVVAAPANGAVAVNGLSLDYTPAAGFSGDDSFTYTASGPGGTSVPATVTITVNPVPVAVSREVAVQPATPVQVELTEGATGGPFTGATLVALAPASSGTAAVTSVGSGYVLEYTPATDFTGVATAQFTLTNAHATSAVATITFTVEPRPDPTRDPEVQGLLDAQIESAKRFATSQIGNFQQRLQQLRNGGGSGTSNGIGFAIDSRCAEQPLQPRSLSGGCDLAYGQDGLPATPPADASGTAPQDRGSPFGFWTGGMIRSGSQDGRDGNADISFETDGISAGVDYRLNDAFAFGAGIGWGQDESEIGENGSFVDGDATSFVVYASYHPEGRWFVDGLLGYQRLSYDLKRYLTGAGGFVRGERDGDQWFGSVSTGADIGWKTMQFTPYARLDLARGTLDGYAESGHPILALRYGDVDLETSTGNLGLHLQFFNESVHGRFVPQLRIEYQHDFNGRSGGTVQYADLASGPLFLLESSGYDNNRWIFGAGAQLQTFNDWLIGLEYRGQIGSSGEADNGVLLKLQKDL